MQFSNSNLLGTIVLLLDIFAIVSVLLGSSPVMRKLLWIVVILLLPVIGLVLYFLLGRNSSDVPPGDFGWPMKK